METPAAVVGFVRAEPVFARELSGQMNAGLRATGTLVWDGTSPVEARLAVHAVYRLTINGQFVSAGPARAAHGHLRLDIVPLPTTLLRAGENRCVLEVVAYHTPCYSHANDPGFLQAEVRVGERVVLWTGAGPAEPGQLRLTTWGQRATHTRRYALQRGFSEVYLACSEPDVALTSIRRSPRRLLPRRVPMPTFELPPAERAYERLSVRKADPAREPAYWWESKPSEGLGVQFERSAWSSDPHREAWEHRFEPLGASTAWPIRLCSSAALLRLPAEYSGMIRLSLRSETGGRVVVSFDELHSHTDGRGGVDERRLECVNTVSWAFGPGEHLLETLEPYSVKFLRVWLPDGNAELQEIAVRRMEYPPAGLRTLATGDAGLDRIYSAAVATFCQNATDLLMDCPSRERAGWLGDSFFTARASFALTGNTTAEHAFLENYLLSPPSAHLPEGQLPMCYPADHPDGTFIPQWPLWLILQLQEFAGRGGDRTLVEAFRPRVERLMGWFERFEREDGVLQGLPGWSFIEWSKANEFQQDLNYPTSMVYAAALDAAGGLFGRADWQRKAAPIRAAVASESYDGAWFVDNALTDASAPHGFTPTGNRTEVCQYYAFYFGLATPQSHPELWRRLVGDFGPGRTAYPEVHAANMIWGIMLRLELLRRYGLREQTLRELKGYLLPMAEATGTLWEHSDHRASCNHGFASHAAFLLWQEAGKGGAI